MKTDLASSLTSDWDTSLPDWKERIVDRRPLIPDLPLFDAVADKALAIFKRLKIPDDIGTPRTFGEAGDDWIFDFVRAVFGSYDPVRKVRMIREFLLMVPKGNAKTTYAAAIILVAAIMNERPNAELMLIAPSQKIAKRAFTQAAGMIRLDETLSDVFKATPHNNEIAKLDEVVPSKIMIVSADPSVVTGAMASFTLIDETHEFSKMSRAEAVFTEIKGSLGKRPDGFLLQITTQSKEPPSGVWKSELAIARKVRDGELRRSLLPVLYELPPEMSQNDGWRDPKTWKMVNPNLNKSVTEDYIASAIEEAQIEGLHKLAMVVSQHLNVEVGQGMHADRWPGALYWQQCGDRALDLEELIRRSEVCVVGVDGGGLDDLFALSVIGRERETRNWLHWAHAWAFDDVLKQRPEIVPKLRDFEKAGDLTMCDLVGDDVRGACDIVDRLEAAGLLPVDSPAIALDSHGISELLDELEARGFAEERFISVGQGWKLQPAVVTLPRRLKDRKLIHGATGLMTWNVGNAKTELKGSNYIVTKQVAGSAKIDALMATFNAAMLMFGNPEGIGPSVYETRGIRRV
ncbi:terminase large subunit domain-containing protein [Paracoccus litorisediminis]|uniref:terminase large subunit domain-containing protein n=1 Tax=Paracoccus litorisediminis TaxID=2006130 RepID=UPI00373543E6